MRREEITLTLQDRERKVPNIQTLKFVSGCFVLHEIVDVHSNPLVTSVSSLVSFGPRIMECLAPQGKLSCDSTIL